MLTRRRRRFRRADPGLLDVPRCRVAHRVAAAADAELAADRRQRQHRHGRVAAVAVAFEPPAAADQRRRASAYSSAARSSASASMPASAAARSNVQRRRARATGRRRTCARRNASSAQPFSNRWRWMASATATSVPGPHARCKSAVRPAASSRIDDDELRAAPLRLAHVGHEMDAGRRRIDAPQHDQRGVGIILVGDRAILP